MKEVNEKLETLFNSCFQKKKRKEKKNFLKTKDMEVNDALTIFTYEF